MSISIYVLRKKQFRQLMCENHIFSYLVMTVCTITMAVGVRTLSRKLKLDAEIGGFS